ncbi:nucleolysin TIA-1 isoform p40 isoform 2 [Danaus plexippus plexippus]|uniref:Nucleolysin TIA-1 isoform p40 isoform 2 n=1 Tax=Danaus plexippus plexippus TaxID=278856 RepID=A0A212FER6_DANPL|nr:nucleolysin TIA-1 isoform p40 isoform 2 [Danaus plexippus plexippus]
MLTMSTLMMPAATMTTMTNAGPIPVAAATKLEPKLLQLPHPALMPQIPQQQHHHQHPHGNNNKLGIVENAPNVQILGSTNLGSKVHLDILDFANLNRVFLILLAISLSLDPSTNSFRLNSLRLERH